MSANPNLKADLDRAFEKMGPVAMTAQGSVGVTAEPKPIFADILENSIPSSLKHAIHIARHWQGVPDDVTDSDALAKGIITPELLMLILQIVQDLMQNCLSNKPASSFRRVRAYLETTKELDRIGDTMRLNWLIDRWFVRLGVVRDRGDVTELRQAICSCANGCSEDDFRSVQTEMLFMTV